MFKFTGRTGFSYLLLGVLMLGALSIAACGQERPLRVGANPWPGYLGLYHAREQDLLDPLQVRLVDFDSAEDVMRALRNQAIDAAAVTLDEALQLLESGYPVAIVMAFDISSGADALIGHQPEASLEDLHGKRIGVETSALGAYMLARILEKAGLEVGDVDVLHMPLADHSAAFTSGRVDYVVTFEPQRSRLLERGGHVIFSSADLPGEIVDVLVVGTDTLQAKAGMIRHLVDAYFNGLDSMLADPEAAAENLAGRTGLRPEQVVESWELMSLTRRDDNLRLLGGGQPALVSTLERLENVMIGSGLLRAPVLERGVLRADFLRDEAP